MTKPRLLMCTLLVMLTLTGLARAEAQVQPLLSVPDATKLGYAATWGSGLEVNTHKGDRIAYATVLGDALVLVEWSSNLVTAISLKDGTVRWREALGEKLDRVLGVVGAGKEWAVCNDTRLYCVTPDTGHILRIIDLDSSASAMAVVVGNLAIIPGVNGRVFTEDLTTGNPLWAYQLRSVVDVMPLVTKAGVIAADLSGNVVLIDPDHGQMRWANRTFGPTKAMPADNRQLVFIPSTDNALYAWDLRTGQDQWIFHAGEPLTQSPVALGPSVFLPLPAAKQLVALNAVSGKPLWRIDAVVNTMVPVKAGLLLAVPQGLQLIDPQTGKTVAAAALAGDLQYVLTGPAGSLIIITPQGRMARLDPLP